MDAPRHGESDEQLRGRHARIRPPSARSTADSRSGCSATSCPGRARVIDERQSADIAKDLRCSEAVVRKWVSRGLAQVREELGER